MTNSYNAIFAKRSSLAREYNRNTSNVSMETRPSVVPTVEKYTNGGPRATDTSVNRANIK